MPLAARDEARGNNAVTAIERGGVALFVRADLPTREGREWRAPSAVDD